MQCIRERMDQYDSTPSFDVPRWYAVYTWARHEKTVARHFQERGITCFLPLYLSSRQWNKRVVQVSMPLFPGYVFIKTEWQTRHEPLEVPGVVRFVGAARSPTEIPGDEIEGLRTAVSSGGRMEPHAYLAPGNRVRIASGPMAGITGIIDRSAKKCRIVISVEMIMRSVAVELDASILVAEA